MAREKKTKTGEQQRSVSVDTEKMIQGVNIVFSGAVKMLEAMGSAIDGSLVLNTANVAIFKDTGGNGDDNGGDNSGESENKATADDDCTEAVEEEPKAESMAEPESEAQENQEKSDASPSVTIDDITRIIVRKIKQKKSNNEKIGQILKSYGVGKVSDLSPEKYEAFVTDLAAL